MNLPATSTSSPVRLGIHDASRAEWSVVVPLPLAGPLSYVIDVEFAIPAQAFVRHTSWDHLQCFVRLDGGAAGRLQQSAVTIDALRRTVLAHAQRLSRESEAFARTCRLAASLVVAGSATPPDLVASIEAAANWIGAARRELLEPVAGEAPELRRERRLADEYLSVRLLEFLAGAERALVSVMHSRAGHSEALLEAIQEAEDAAADLLERELEHRAEAKYVCADPESLAAQERYLERASQLKKHFQEVLFLEAEHVQIADRIQHAAAALAGIVAAAAAFAIQFWVTAHAARAERIGSSLVFLTLIAGISYAFRDRLKEVGRSWISGRVRRHYAERVARFRAPSRRLPGRDVIASAKESFHTSARHALDPLNPAAGARQEIIRLHYRHRGVVMPQAQLAHSGVERVKLTFRYDLSPMFARLDDAVKEIPVLDAEARRVRFVEAPRCYRVPMEVGVRIGEEQCVERAVLVMHKRGLDRIDAHSSEVSMSLRSAALQLDEDDLGGVEPAATSSDFVLREAPVSDEDLSSLHASSRADDSGELPAAAAAAAAVRVEPARQDGRTQAVEPARQDGRTKAVEPARQDGRTQAVEPARQDGRTNVDESGERLRGRDESGEHEVHGEPAPRSSLAAE